MDKKDQWDFKEWNWTAIAILALNAYYWVTAYYFGFFVTTIWTVIIFAVVGIYLRITGRA